MGKIIIYIEDDTVSAFNVIKGEPIRPKGLESMKLDSTESVSDFCEILRNKFNIDDFSEIDMSIYLVNEGADEEKLTALREELQNAYNYCENTVENTVELKRNIDKQNIELINENEKLKSKLEASIKETADLKEKLSELETQLQELNKFKEGVTKAIEKKKENQTIKKNTEINNKANDLNRLCRINFLMDCKEDKNRLIQPNIEDIKNSKKYGLIFHRLKNDQSIIKGNSCIGTYKINTSSVSILNLYKLQAIGEIPKKTKCEGKLFYVVENGFTVKEGDVVAVIGDEDWTTKDVVECLKRNSYDIQYVKNYENTVHPNNCENNPLIYDAETH